MVRDVPQLAIQERHEPVESGAIAVAPRAKEYGYIVGDGLHAGR